MRSRNACGAWFGLFLVVALGTACGGGGGGAGGGSSPPAVAITVQPADQSVVVGDTATFAVVATQATAYQWERSTDGGTTFVAVVGATGASLTTPVTVLADDGTRYRVVVSGATRSVTSAAARLTVTAATALPAFTTQPGNASVLAPDPATFTVVATGTPTPTLQWQVSTDGGASYHDLVGATGSSYTTPATSAGDDGARFRVIATNVVGSTTSAFATLAVSVPSLPSFTTQPADVAITAGESAQFTVAVSGTPAPSLQWQFSVDGGTSWSNISGATGTVFDVINAALGNDGRQFRAVATNRAGVVNSTAATLTVTAAPATVATLVSATVAGVAPNGMSREPSISADGNLIAFRSDGTNLVAGVTVNGHAYLRNLATGTTTLINQALAGGESARGVTSLKLAAGGRYAVFTSLANDLVAGDTNTVNDVFLRDLQTGTTTRLNVLPDGSQDVDSGGGTGEQPDISADGRWVLMASGVNLAAGGPYDGVRRLFLRDTQGGVTREVPAPVGFGGHRISADGRWVTWIAGDASTTQIGYYDVLPNGLGGHDQGIVFSAAFPEMGGTPSLSADGRHVAFLLKSPTLLGGATASHYQVVVFDRAEPDPALALTLVSTGSAGVGNGPSFQPVLSGDGRYVLFGTNAPNLAGDAAATIRSYVMVRDRVAGTTRVASRRVDGSSVWVTGVGGTRGHFLSGDGATVAFVPEVVNMGLSTTLGDDQVFAAPRP